MVLNKVVEGESSRRLSYLNCPKVSNYIQWGGSKGGWGEGKVGWGRVEYILCVEFKETRLFLVLLEKTHFKKKNLREKDNQIRFQI